MCVFWLATVILWIYDIFIIFLVKWWKTPCKYKKGFMAHSWLSHVLRCVCKCMNIFGAERPVLDISAIETLTLPTLQFRRGWRHQRLHPVMSRRRHPYARWYGGLHFILGWTPSLSYGHIPLLFKILLRKKKKVFIGHGVGRTNIVLIFNRYQNSKFMLEYVCWSDLRGE